MGSRSIVVITTVVLVTALAAGVVLAGADTSKLRKAQSVYMRASDALSAGDTARAREGFEKALELVPQFPEALIGMGLLDIANKDYGAALAHFERARDGYADVGQAMYDLQMDRYRRAQEDIQALRAQQLAPTPATRGRTESAAGTKALQIEQQIRRLEAIQPPVFERSMEPPGEVYFHIGNALFYLNRYDEARQAWETCAEKNPKFPLVHNNLAVLYMKAGRFDDALTSVARAEGLGMTVNPQLKKDLEAGKAAGH